MEAARKFEEAPEKSEKEPHYNFPEIAELEPAMINLVKQLKDKIDQKEYDVLISDDVGGRIPTLIFRKVLKERGADDLDIFFLLAGRKSGPLSQLPGRKKLVENISKKILPLVDRRALVVSEFMASGGSMVELASMLEEAGLKNFDVATAWSRQARAWGAGSETFLGRHTLFHGKKAGEHDAPMLYGIDQTIAGVVKGKDIHILSNKKEAKNILSENPYLSSYLESTKSIQDNVNNAREDVDMMARKILEQVWGR